jgi:prevent-host-death family protein
MVMHLKSSQVQQDFGEVMDQALAGSDVIVERYGNPRVAIISHRRYQQLLETERQLLRMRLQAASAAASARAAHLSDAEVDKLIEEARQEVHAEHKSK